MGGLRAALALTCAVLLAPAWATAGAASSVPPGSTEPPLGTTPPGDIPTEGEVPHAPTTQTTVASSTETGPAPTVPDVDKDVDVAPVIHCVWVTADMDPDEAAIQRVANGMADDLPEPPTPTPCALDPTSGVPMPVAAVGPVASIRPHSGDRPGPRTVEVWTVLSHALGPAAIDDVTVTVRDHLGEPIVVSDADAADAADATGAGVASGQIGSAAADGLAELTADGWGVFAVATFDLSHLDGCGIWSAEIAATAGERIATSSTTFDVVCSIHLAADFDAVDWDDLVPDAESIVEGDLDPVSPDRPTVVNLGNRPIVVATTFAPLCLVGDPATCIHSFGVEFTVADSPTARLGPADAGTELVDPAGVLCPGSSARMDFIVSTPPGAVPGAYRGSLRAVGVSAPDAVCGDAPAPTTTAPSTTSPSTTAAPTTVTATSVPTTTTEATAPTETSEPATPSSTTTTTEPAAPTETSEPATSAPDDTTTTGPTTTITSPTTISPTTIPSTSTPG
ncbi:MAG: hypothetical protein QNJ12_23270 [Ilumatobacter sp.]|uniref:hypothetical protein n=1 Tax=Ilumatobacter sp. TaxID=1967498 RepID=UPI002619AC15|nr:hypothetical protein [Ilumatobacter sp.]MDJ0771727.1 hypothetical protein [Ilumatobacter sp.]